VISKKCGNSELEKRAAKMATATRVGWRVNVRHIIQEQNADAVAFIIHSAKTSRSGVELVGAMYVY